MTRNLIAAFLLSVMLVLAGCNATTGQPTTVGTTTTVPDTDTATTTATTTPPTTDPIYATPLNRSAVIRGHNQALSAGVTFRYVQNATVRRLEPPGLIQYTNLTATVNLTSNALFVRQNVSLQGVSEIYRNESAFASERRVVNGEVQYLDPDARAINATFYKLPPISRYLRGLDYTYTGVRTVDGETVYRYTVDNTTQLTPSEHGLGVLPPENVRAIESELLIAESGVVRSFTYTVTGNNTQGDALQYSLAITYDEVGSATVEAPPWFDGTRNGN